MSTCGSIPTSTPSCLGPEGKRVPVPCLRGCLLASRHSLTPNPAGWTPPALSRGAALQDQGGPQDLKKHDCSRTRPWVWTPGLPHGRQPPWGPQNLLKCQSFGVPSLAVLPEVVLSAGFPWLSSTSAPQGPHNDDSVTRLLCKVCEVCDVIVPPPQHLAQCLTHKRCLN